MQYILLLRGINVGGNHKVSMKELKEQLFHLGYTRIITYINSGNILFHSSKPEKEIKQELSGMLQEKYDFPIFFSLIASAKYKQEAEQLPAWWHEPMARKDVLFFTDEVDKKSVVESLNKMNFHNEIVYAGEIALFWGKYDEKEYLKTAYSKYLIKQSFYKQITIRNGNTFQKLLTLIEE